MKQINSHNAKQLRKLSKICFFSVVIIGTIVLYSYTQCASYRFPADDSITLLSYVIALTALITFTVTFFNSFVSTNVKNTYLRKNRNFYLLSKKFGYSLISSEIFRISLLLLYFIPLAKYLIPKDKLVLSPSKSQFSIDINSLLLSFWYTIYSFCLFSLVLGAYNCLSLLWSRSGMSQSDRDKADDMIEDDYKKEFRETLIHYIENLQKDDPMELIKKKINSFQGGEKLIYLYTVFDVTTTFIYHTLFMNKYGQKKKIPFLKNKSSIVSPRIFRVNRYLKKKWEFLSTLEMKDRSQDLLYFIFHQCKEDTKLCLNICASWEKEYSEIVFVRYPEDDYFSKLQVDQLLYNMAQCYIKVYLHSDTYPEKIITLHEKLNNAIDIGKNGDNKTATPEVEEVLQETQKAIELDYLETAGEFLLTYPWQAREWQVWKVKENYIKLIYNKDRTELLHLLNKQNITDLVLLKAILEFLPIEQIIRHLIYTCAYSHRNYNVSPIVVNYNLYKGIIRDKRVELDKLRKSSSSRASLIESISKDIEKYNIDYYLNNQVVNIIIDSIFSDKKIDQQLVDEISKSFGIVNYLALRSCLTSEVKVSSKISSDIAAESPQKENLRELIERIQKNHPDTIPLVMERLSQILQIK